jgi:hypothetical protein
MTILIAAKEGAITEMLTTKSRSCCSLVLFTILWLALERRWQLELSSKMTVDIIPPKRPVLCA